MPEVPQFAIPTTTLPDLRSDYTIPKPPDLSPLIKLADASASATEAQEGVKAGTYAQTNNPNSQMVTSTIPSDYLAAYNHTVGTIFTTQKQSEIDQGINGLKTQFPNDPQAFDNGLDAFKSSVMANVPALQQAPLLDALDAKATMARNAVWQDHMTTMHGQAQVASDTRLNQLNNQIYQAVLTGGDASLNNPDVQHDIAEHQTLLDAGQASGVGGPLYTPQQAFANATALHVNVVEATYKHNFAVAPGIQNKADFIQSIVEKGIPGITPQAQQQVIGALNQDMKDYRATYSYQRAEASDTVRQLTEYAAAGITPPADLVTQGQQQTLKLGDVHLQNTVNRVVQIGTTMAGFTDQPLAAMAAQRDATQARVMSSAPAATAGYNTMVAGMESSNSATSDNKFGFTDTTMTDLQNRHPELAGLSKNDPQVMATFTNENRATLTAGLGHAPSDQDMYMAHFLGATGAVNFLKADPNAPAASVASAAAVSNNPSVFTPGATVQDIKDGFAARAGSAPSNASSYDIQLLGLQTRAIEQAQKQFADGNAINFAVQHNIAGVPASTLAPVDFSDQKSVDARMDAARVTSARYGIPVSPMLPSEQKALVTNWPNMTPAQQSGMLANFNKFNMTPTEEKTFYDGLAKDDPTLPTLAYMMKDPQQQAQVSDILAGHQFMKTNKEAVDHMGTAGRAIDDELAKIYPPIIDQGGRTLQSQNYMATGIYAQQRQQAGNFDVTDADAPAAAQAAVAKLFGYSSVNQIPVINGQRTQPFEQGIPNARANDVWKLGATDDGIRAMNNGVLPTDNVGSIKQTISAADIAGKGFPLPTKNPGQYYVGMRDVAGNPFILRGSDGKNFVWNYQSQKTSFDAMPQVPEDAAPTTAPIPGQQ